MASYTPLSISSYALLMDIAFEIMADADMWAVRSQARSSRGGAHARGEKARAEVPHAAARGDHGYYAAAQGAAISACTEVDGARIFVPSDVFRQHALGSLD
ncbi:hypothetical protein C8J57DRAFT_1467306 [Mycena rebaudengoi]|nr:hypothetical protein C8J57DRAFT_1467306 [Mycena rebaudengoi]